MKSKATSWLLAFLLCGLCWHLISGCESDPVLAPQSGEEEEEGSYGASTLPGSGPDGEARAKANPELF